MFILQQAGLAGAITDSGKLQEKVDKTWTRAGDTIIRTVRTPDGAVLSQRVYDRATGKFIKEGPPEGAEQPLKAEKPAAGSEKKGEASEKVKKEEEASAASGSTAVWTNTLRMDARLESTSGNSAHSYQELFNHKDGLGIGKLELKRVSDKRLFRFNADSFGTWNRSYGTSLSFRNRAEFSVKAKVQRTEWDFGSILDPTSTRDSFKLDAAWDRPDLKWRPRVTIGLNGYDCNGDILRLQGSSDQPYPHARLQNAWNPSNRNFDLGVFGGHGRLDFSLSYGEQSSGDTTTKIYQRDIDFNGIRDLLNVWNWQQSFSRTVGGNVKYQFSDKYSFLVGVTTTNSDSDYDTIRYRFEPAGVLQSSQNIGGPAGNNHGTLDGSTRLEEYVFDAKPNDKWNVQSRIERRFIKADGSGSFHNLNASGTLIGADDSVTANRIAEGLFETRADYYGFAHTPVYFGYRFLNRFEDDDDTLGTYDIFGGIRTAAAANTRSIVDRVTRETTERMGYLGIRHRFNSKVSLDLRHESGDTNDNNYNPGMVAGRDQTTMVGSYGKTRQVATIRAKPINDVQVMLKLRRDYTDRRDIGTGDERKAFALYTNWTPVKRNFTVGAGYTNTIGDYSLRFASYHDEIETLTLNATYRFDDKWSALLDLAQSASGDVTRLDYQTGQIKILRKLKKGHEASVGYARRHYENLNLSTEDFTNNVFLLSYELPL